VVVHENTGGIYTGIGGVTQKGTGREQDLADLKILERISALDSRSPK